MEIKTKQDGYLLLEILVALVLVAGISFAIALMHTQLIQWQKEAEQYLVGTNLACEQLFHLQSKSCYQPKTSGFQVKTDTIPIDFPVPYSLYQVTVTFKTIRGITKEIMLVGGKT
jgi:Tfp pilus assembly protein PilV